MNANLTLWLIVTACGAAGCAARFGAVLFFRSLPIGFPMATLFVNVLGGLAMGAVVAYAQSRQDFSEALRLGLTTGFLGGFTTFSAFSIETLLLWRNDQLGLAFANIALNVVLSVGACAVGYGLLKTAQA